MGLKSGPPPHHLVTEGNLLKELVGATVTAGVIKAGTAIGASIGIQPTEAIEEVTPALTRHTVGSFATFRAPDSRNIPCHGESLCLREASLGVDLYRNPNPPRNQRQEGLGEKRASLISWLRRVELNHRPADYASIALSLPVHCQRTYLFHGKRRQPSYGVRSLARCLSCWYSCRSQAACTLAK